MKKLLWVLVIALLGWNSWLTYNIYFVHEEEPEEETTIALDPGTTIVYNTVNGYTTDITEIVEEVQPKTVVVSVTDAYDTVNTGSGIIYRANGRDCYILTSQSLLIEDAAVIVRFDNNITMEAEIAGSDPRTDIAVLLVHPEFDVEAIRVGDSDLIRQGEYVVAMSGRNPVIGSGPISFGVVAQPMQIIRQGNEETPGIVVSMLFSDVVLTDSGIGGPLINLSGEMVGFLSRRMSSMENLSRLSGAVAASEVQIIADQLIAEGEVSRVYLGITGRNIEDMLLYEKSGSGLQLDITEGIVITGIAENSPAEASELQLNDVLLMINDTDVHTVRQMRDYLYSYRYPEEEEEDEFTLTVNRGGNVITLQVDPQ